MKKFFLISIAVVLLLVVCVPFVPPIYNRYTKPLWNNYMAGKEWYSKVDPENTEQVRDFCERRGYSTKYYVLVDFSIPSGKKRFFVYDLQSGRKLMSSYFGNRNGRSDKELMKYLGPRILNGTNLHDTGGRVDAYFMKVDDVTPAIDYIERDAANPKRDRYFFFSDNTCGGVARDAFDRTRCYPSRVLNKWFDIVGNFIPLPSHIWSALTHSGNISGLSGLSPEGNAPSLNTNKEVYRTSGK